MMKNELVTIDVKTTILSLCDNCKTPNRILYEDIKDSRIHFESTCLCDCEQERVKQREEIDKKLAVEKRREDKLPACFHGMTFDKDDGKDIDTTKTLKNYVDNFNNFQKTGQGILLWGDVGTGKTFGAMCIANALIDKGINCGYTTLVDIIRIASNFNNAFTFKRLLWNKALVIDDLGAQRDSSFAQEQVYDFINDCNANNICLIITTNLTPSELQKAAADKDNITYARIYSRILEKCYPIKVNSVQRRLANQERRKEEFGKLLKGNRN